MAFLNSSFTTTLATAGTALLSLSFVFAGTAQEVLGSCIFLFVKHPFDVLDRVDINGDQLIVKHISLLSTVFKCVGNHKLTQVPNSVLNTLWIQNVSRSEAMREQLLIYVSFDTSLEDLQLLRNEIHTFVSDKENSRDFQQDVDVEVTGLAEMNKMELKVEIRHKSNWANETVRAARRSKFMCALVLALRKIPIIAPGGGSAALGSADQPSYTVSVSDAQAASARDTYKKSQDAKRLYPTEKQNAGESNPNRGMSTGAEAFNPHDSAAPPPLRSRYAPPSESHVLNTLNSRHPAADTASHPLDLIEPSTPKSVAQTTLYTEEGTDMDRGTSIDEGRSLMHRQSTRGKRKSPKASTIAAKFPPHFDKGSLPPLQTSISNRLDYTQSPRFEYDPYTYIPPPSQTQGPKDESKSFQQQGIRTPANTHSQSMEAESPIIPPSTVMRSGFNTRDPQRPPPPQSSSQPRTAPAIAPPMSSYHPSVPPKDTPPGSSAGLRNTQPFSNVITSTTGAHSAAPTSALSPTAPGAEFQQTRGTSPVRNPFQIHALKSQAQGAGTPRAVPQPPSEAGPAAYIGPARARADSSTSGPAGSVLPGQVRRPVPGNGNSFARDKAGPVSGPGPLSPAPPVSGNGNGGSEGAIPPPRGDSLPPR